MCIVLSTTHSPKTNPYVVQNFAFPILSNFSFFFHSFSSLIWFSVLFSLPFLFIYCPFFFSSSIVYYYLHHPFTFSHLHTFISLSQKPHHRTYSRLHLFTPSPLHLFIFSSHNPLTTSSLHFFTYLRLPLFTSSLHHLFIFSSLSFLLSYLFNISWFITCYFFPLYHVFIFSLDNLSLFHSYHFSYTEGLDIRLSIFRKQVF